MSEHPDANKTDIPIVDLSSPEAPQRLLDAATRYGFIFIKHENLELTPDDVKDMFAASKELFAAPTEVKEPCSIHSSASGKNHGWLGMHFETLDPAVQKKGDYKEGFNIGEYVDGKPQQPFPEPLKPYEGQVASFSTKCHNLCNLIMRLLAHALEIPEREGADTWFAKRHDPSKGLSGSILRLLYYPKLPAAAAIDPSEDVRAGAHSDYGSVTLLFRLPGQPGLEIQTEHGDWVPVPVNPDPSHAELPILVNIGDLLSYWTAGLLRSTVHRVIFPAQGQAADRYSIAYFCHPEDDAKLVEIPSQVVKQHREATGLAASAGANLMTARQHLDSRLAATYGI